MKMQKVKDNLKAIALKNSKHNHGLLFKEDRRDDIDDRFGISFGNAKPKYDALSYYRYDYDQSPNNTCTQCGVGLAMSEQMSVRFSIDAITKLLVKQGRISGNGFCSQRPPMDVVVNQGLIPHHAHPDAKNAPWSSLKQWTTQVQSAYDNASEKLKMSRYRKLTSEAAVIEALDAGFVPIVASKWKSAMNRPLPPNFYLRFEGYEIGGHQYRITGYRKDGADFENGQSFGASYGDKGKAYNETLFGSGYYEVFYIHYNESPLLPMSVLRPLFLIQHEGLMVKAHAHHGVPECWVIEDGKKRHVRGDDNMATFFDLQRKVGLTFVNKTVLDSVEQGEEYPLI